MLLEFDRTEEALESYNIAQKIQDLDINIYYNKGICLYNLKKYDEALLTCQEALRIDPTNSNSYFI